jgi:hypothetical protein
MEGDSFRGSSNCCLWYGFCGFLRRQVYNLLDSHTNQRWVSSGHAQTKGRESSPASGGLAWLVKRELSHRFIRQISLPPAIDSQLQW